MERIKKSLSKFFDTIEKANWLTSKEKSLLKFCLLMYNFSRIEQSYKYDYEDLFIDIDNNNINNLNYREYQLIIRSVFYDSEHSIETFDDLESILIYNGQKTTKIEHFKNRYDWLSVYLYYYYITEESNIYNKTIIDKDLKFLELYGEEDYYKTFFYRTFIILTLFSNYIFFSCDSIYKKFIYQLIYEISIINLKIFKNINLIKIFPKIEKIYSEPELCIYIHPGSIMYLILDIVSPEKDYKEFYSFFLEILGFSEKFISNIVSHSEEINNFLFTIRLGLPWFAFSDINNTDLCFDNKSNYLKQLKDTLKTLIEFLNFCENHNDIKIVNNLFSTIIKRINLKDPEINNDIKDLFLEKIVSDLEII